MAYLTDFIAISVYVALGLIIMGFGCFWLISWCRAHSGMR